MQRADVVNVDHLVYETKDLDATLDYLERLLGVRAIRGGQHAGRGTCNALLGLGPRMYLEILAPDPDQSQPVGGRWMGLDDLTSPRLVTWAAKAYHLQAVVDRAARHGVRLGGIVPGSRSRSDGTVLSWCFTDPQELVGDGIIPFFIDWGDSPHPADSAPSGLTLVSLRAEHPRANGLSAALGALGLQVSVSEGPSPALVATILTPQGVVELR